MEVIGWSLLVNWKGDVDQLLVNWKGGVDQLLV